MWHIGVYLGVKDCEVYLCFVAIVRVMVPVYYVDFVVFFLYISGECYRFLHGG